MTEAELLATETAKVMVKIVKPLQTRLAAVEAELATLKAAPLLKDAGIWRHGTTYGLGDVAQFSGSPWVCIKAHTANGPTADHACWRLWQKREKPRTNGV